MAENPGDYFEYQGGAAFYVGEEAPDADGNRQVRLAVVPPTVLRADALGLDLAPVRQEQAAVQSPVSSQAGGSETGSAMAPADVPQTGDIPAPGPGGSTGDTVVVGSGVSGQPIDRPRDEDTRPGEPGFPPTPGSSGAAGISAGSGSGTTPASS